MITKTLLALLLIALIYAVGWLWAPDLSREVLEQRYLAEADDLVEVAGTELHLRASGPVAGPAIVLLHGFGASLHTWEDWATPLAEHYRVLRFDLPGTGLSPPDRTGNYSDERLIEIIDALLDQQSAERATIVGNSVGGRIAWRYAAARPDRVERLVLISPDGFESLGLVYGEAPAVPAVMQAMRYFLPKFMVRSNLEQSYGDSALLSTPVIDRYYELLRAPGVRAALLDRMAQTVLVDPAQVLPGINCPVLLLWGAKDRLIPISNAADYLALLPNAELVQFSELGHLPMEEAPAESLAPLLAFLKK